MKQIIGVVRAAGPQAAIAGGPTPLLQTGNGTLLERAIRSLRAVTEVPLFVTVQEHHGPVAAQARRQGAHVISLPSGTEETLPWIVSTLSVSGEVSLGTGARILLLRVDAPLIASDTLRQLSETPVQASSGTAEQGEGLPLIIPFSGADEALDPEGVGVMAVDVPEGTHADAFTEPTWGPRVGVPVEDRHLKLRLRDVATYRRHFPDAFRKRFQKW